MKESKEIQEEERQPMEGKHHHDHISRITGGLILIVLGVLFLLATFGHISWGDWWAYFLVGLGIILIIDVVIRSVVPEYQQDPTGKLIGGVVLIIIGGAFIFGFTRWWPLIIIAVGVVIIFTSLFRLGKKE